MTYLLTYVLPINRTTSKCIKSFYKYMYNRSDMKLHFLTNFIKHIMKVLVILDLYVHLVLVCQYL